MCINWLSLKDNLVTVKFTICLQYCVAFFTIFNGAGLHFKNLLKCVDIHLWKTAKLEQLNKN